MQAGCRAAAAALLLQLHKAGDGDLGRILTEAVVAGGVELQNCSLPALAAGRPCRETEVGEQERGLSAGCERS